MWFISLVFGNDGFQDMFVYQPTLNKLDLKEDRAMIMLLVGNQSGRILLNFRYYILLSRNASFWI